MIEGFKFEFLQWFVLWKIPLDLNDTLSHWRYLTWSLWTNILLICPHYCWRNPGYRLYFEIQKVWLKWIVIMFFSSSDLKIKRPWSLISKKWSEIDDGCLGLNGLFRPWSLWGGAIDYTVPVIKMMLFFIYICLVDLWKMYKTDCFVKMSFKILKKLNHHHFRHFIACWPFILS